MSISLTKKDRCRTIEPGKVYNEDSPLVYFYKNKSRFIRRADTSQASSTVLKSSQNSLPALQTNVNSSFTTDGYQKRLSNNLLIKNNESLRAYRIRLRALLDSQFSVNIGKVKPKSPESNTNLIQLKINQLKTRKKISLLKPVEEKPKPARVYKPAKDPYFVANVLSKPNFTSFPVLLNIFNEQITTFPYCFRINQNSIPAEVKLENFRRNQPEPQKMQKPGAVEVKRIKEIREKHPWTRRVFFNIQKVDCMTKAFIINLECVFDSTCFLPSAVQSLKLLAGHIHLILVIPTEAQAAQVIQAAENSEIVFSAIYFIENKEKLRSLSDKVKLLDYSAIFLDFHCFEPSEDCLVFAVHELEELDGLTQDKIVGVQVGTSIRCFVQNIPFCSHEFSKQPVTVLMFQTLIDQECENLLRAAEVFMAFLRFNFSMRNNFDIKKVLKESNWDLVETCLPFKATLKNQVLVQSYKDWNGFKEGGEKGFLYNLFVY